MSLLTDPPSFVLEFPPFSECFSCFCPVQGKSVEKGDQLELAYIYSMLKQLQKTTEKDPLSGLDEEGLRQFSDPPKIRPQDYKSRAQRKEERLEKLAKYFNDPEHKKIRRQKQQQAGKDKLWQLIKEMTKEEGRSYVKDLKKEKEALKLKVRQAMGQGQVFMLDLVYQQKMSHKENRSLASQIELIMMVIRHFEHPPSVHLCSFEGGIRQKLQTMEYQHWAMSVHAQNVLDTAKKLGKKLIYLSPDAPLELETIDRDTAYILGGLVDRSIIKNASLKRAEDLGVEARRLPITQYMKGRLCLNLDHVVNMVCSFQENKNWKKAFDFAAPKRWRKEEQQQKKVEGEAQVSRKSEGTAMSLLNGSQRQAEEGPRANEEGEE